MKTKLFFLLIFNLSLLIVNTCMGQAGEWVWLKGDSIPNQPGNFGVQGVPSPSNNPPSLYEPCEWTDLNGNFWLFGGWGGGMHDDIWKLNPITNEWTWMKGSGTTSQLPIYGTQGIPSALNTPGNYQWCAASWVDQSGNFWMFGGSAGGSYCYNLLWKYNINTNEWTWIKGSFITNDPGSYGTQGVSDPSNNPCARWETAATWTDNFGNLWLFGGFTNSGNLNDLWRYNIDTNIWTWIKGSQSVNQPGIYGTLGIENNLNTPGARQVYSKWKDNSGKLWLFAGVRWSSSRFNDLWRYNPNTNNWSWIKGDSSINATGIYGVKCVSSVTNVPGSRFENRTAWTDQSGDFWFFGGGKGVTLSQVRNGLWKYCVVTNQWIWISGNKIANPSADWGILGVSSPANKPDGRAGGVGWTDHNGHLYLFGGSTSPFIHSYNDIWKFTIDTTCGVCPAGTSIEENSNGSSTIEIFPNPSSDNFTVRSSNNVIDKIEIFNLLGEEVYEKQLSAAECQLSTRRFGNGIYIVKIYTHEKIFQKKLMVNH